MFFCIVSVAAADTDFENSGNYVMLRYFEAPCADNGTQQVGEISLLDSLPADSDTLPASNLPASQFIGSHMNMNFRKLPGAMTEFDARTSAGGFDAGHLAATGDIWRRDDLHAGAYERARY